MFLLFLKSNPLKCNKFLKQPQQLTSTIQQKDSILFRKTRMQFLQEKRLEITSIFLNFFDLLYQFSPNRNFQYSFSQCRKEKN
jgi:hypothetical protein